jgi:cobalt/nickel transport system permease protein
MRRAGPMTWFVVGGLVLAIALALFVSPWASSAPDGLNKVAIDKGFDAQAEDHALDDSPLAGYAVEDVDNEEVSKALSGLIGVLITFGVGMVLFGGLTHLRDRGRERDGALAPRATP